MIDRKAGNRNPIGMNNLNNRKEGNPISIGFFSVNPTETQRNRKKNRFLDR